MAPARCRLKIAGQLADQRIAVRLDMAPVMTGIITVTAQRRADNVARQHLEPVYEPHTLPNGAGPGIPAWDAPLRHVTVDGWCR